ncbi:fimbria/pilus outer membrane usher protein [Entomohabitans teleogrylli]|uniref:fimbria/pilus outer membrane usher protein n=1 Tax=Entomohabitans teleogrylli TaxID=1384589 RepID=UPI00073D250F|nr:fimbria/pilus outer membrane usher protein [Entomohabitans teleogrylli]
MNIACKIRQGILLNAITLALWPYYGEAETFNSSLLVGDSSQKEWGKGAPIISPGQYELDIYVDGEWKGKYQVSIAGNNSQDFTMKKRDALLLGISHLDHLQHKNDTDDIALNDILHGGKSTLHTGELRLDLEVPQAYVAPHDKNWVAPALWNQGINGLYTNYNLNAYAGKDKAYDSGTSRSAFLSLHSGLNLFGWYLRDNSTWQHDSQGGSNWFTSSRYLEKPIAPLTMLMRAGEMYTSSDYFDSIAFRGITLNKDQQMLPDKDQVYMPVITGNATSNAVVLVSQNHKVIYQISVPPGPFAIRDLMPTGSRDDLEVEVRNSGGLTERFTVPFATMSTMLRPGSSDFRVNVGKVYASGYGERPWFGQADYSRGINNYWTWFNGLTVSQNYYALLMGSAVSFPWMGSMTASVEQTRWRDESSRRGEKYSLSWSKYLPTKTNVTLATWYYRTRDYMTLPEFVSRDSQRQYVSTFGSKQAFSVALSQPLGDDMGRLALDAWFRNYRGDRSSTRQYNLTYSNRFQQINYMLSLGRREYSRSSSASVDSAPRRSETSATFSLTIPFSLFDSPASINARSRMNNGHYASSSLGMSGVARDIDYSVDFSHDRAGSGVSTDLYAGWKSPWARLNAGVSDSADYRQASVGASGSLLAWSGGVLAGPDSGSNFVIVEAPGIEGAEINNDHAQRTNRRGQALVSGAVAYRMNQFWLDTSNSENPDIDVQSNVAHVAPYEGSISWVKYKTDPRKLFILRLQNEDGSPVAFGASIYDSAGQEVGYVAQGSQAYIKANTLPSSLRIGLKARACVIAHPAENQINICTARKDRTHV